MNIATIKKWAFISGIIILIINVFGICSIALRYGDNFFDWFFDRFFYTLRDNEATPFAVLSILSSALLIYGITPTNNIVYLKRAKAVFIIGIVVLIYLIITFLCDNSDNYWINALLLFTSSAVMIVFSVMFSIKKQSDNLVENEKSDDNINQI